MRGTSIGSYFHIFNMYYISSMVLALYKLYSFAYIQYIKLVKNKNSSITPHANPRGAYRYIKCVGDF